MATITITNSSSVPIYYGYCKTDGTLDNGTVNDSGTATFDSKEDCLICLIGDEFSVMTPSITGADFEAMSNGYVWSVLPTEETVSITFSE